MKIESPWVMGLGGLLASAAVRAWMGTLEGRAALYDSRADPAVRAGPAPNLHLLARIYPLPAFSPPALQHCHAAQSAPGRGSAFASGTADGVSIRPRLDAARWSRGAAAMLRTQRDIHLAITPDGPRGPRRTMAPGAVFLASRLGLPLIAMGFGFDRPWRVRSAWDQFAIPRPFSRATRHSESGDPGAGRIGPRRVGALPRARRRVAARVDRGCGALGAFGGTARRRDFRGTGARHGAVGARGR